MAEVPPAEVPTAEVPVAEVPVAGAADAVSPVPPQAPRTPTRFASDQQVTFDAPTRDAFGFGQEVDITAEVEDNAFSMAQHTEVTAPVRGDLLVFGQSLRIDAPVAGDVYAMGQSVEVTPQGSIGGDLMAGGERIEVRGPVAGDVNVGAGALALGAPIGGDVTADVGELTVEAGASIGGDLTYEAPEEASIDPGVVGGESAFTLEVREDGDDEEDAPPSLLGRLIGWGLWTAWSLVAHAMVGAVILALGGATAARIAGHARTDPGRALGIGAAVMATLFVGSLFACLLVVPLPLGVLGFLLFGALAYTAKVFTAQALGAEILARTDQAVPEVFAPYVAMLVGLLPIIVLGQVPWLGVLVSMVATLVGVGALWMLRSRPAAV